MGTTPRYREIADELRDAIVRGRELAIRDKTFPLGADARLPTEPELAELYAASRSTIRGALSQLTAEGMLETRGRAGTFVRLLQRLQRPLLARWQTRDSEGDTWSAHVRAAGRKPSHDFEFRIVPASESVAAALRLEPNALVVVREQLRYIDEIPWSQATGYYPYDIAKDARIDDPHDIQEGAARRLAEHGYRDERLTFQVGARLATAEEVSTFNLGEGVNILTLDRIMWSNGRPTRLMRELDPADRNDWVGEIALDGGAQ